MDVLMRAGGLAAMAIAAIVLDLSESSPAWAEVTIARFEPARTDSLLVCEMDIRGLPDPASRETLESGLPSSFVFAFSVENSGGVEISRAEVEVRVEPDLWEQRFSVRSPLRDWRVETLAEVGAIMRALGPLPVLSLDVLGDRSARIRTALTVHALAPAEVDELHRVVSGDTREPDRREVSVGLGSLVRFFLGDRDGGGPDADFVSPLFHPPNLLELATRDRESAPDAKESP